MFVKVFALVELAKSTQYKLDIVNRKQTTKKIYTPQTTPKEKKKKIHTPNAAPFSELFLNETL